MAYDVTMAKKQKYRLEALLRLKQREKHVVEIALARAINELRKAEEKEKTLQQEKDELIAAWMSKRHDMDVEMNQGGRVFDGTLYVNFLRKLKEDEETKVEEIREQQKKIEQCKILIARRRREYIDASRALQVMEKHKELWEKKIAQEISRAEEKQYDELSTTIHQLRRWRGESGTEGKALGY